MRTTTAPATLAFHLPRRPVITGTHVAELLEHPDAVLLQHDADGSVEVAGRQLPGTVVLRTHAWAHEHYQTALADALEAGTSTAVRTVRRAAADAGNADLAAEHAELASFIGSDAL